LSYHCHLDVIVFVFVVDFVIVIVAVFLLSSSSCHLGVVVIVLLSSSLLLLFQHPLPPLHPSLPSPLHINSTTTSG
jgi:hypothetical protein